MTWGWGSGSAGVGLTANQRDVETDTSGFQATWLTTITRDTTIYRSGAASLKIDPTGITQEGGAWVTAGLTHSLWSVDHENQLVGAGAWLTGTVTATAWMRTDAAGVANAAQGYSELSFWDAGDNFLSQEGGDNNVPDDGVALGTSWTQLTTSATPPVGAAWVTWILFSGPYPLTSGGNTIWIDDMSLTGLATGAASSWQVIS